MKACIFLICLILLSGCKDYNIDVTVLAPPEDQAVPVYVNIIIIGNTDDDALPFDIKASGLPAS